MRPRGHRTRRGRGGLWGRWGDRPGCPRRYTIRAGDQFGERSAPGQTVQFTALALDSALTPVAAGTFTWESSDTAIVRVDRSGLATAVRPGSARITARHGTVDGWAVLVVLQPVASIALSVPHQPVVPAAAFFVRSTLRSSGGDTLLTQARELAWTTSAPGVATVTPEGQVAAIAPGNATITLTAVHEGLSATVAVSVEKISYRVVQYTDDWGGPGFGCGLTSVGALYCSGLSFPDQLYTADFWYGVQGSIIPTIVAPGRTFDSLTMGNEHGCALTSEGQAWCWGRNSSGGLGNGTTEDSWEPVPVSGGHRFVSLAAGRERTCGIAVGGTTYCWGLNDRGDFGNGSTTSTTVPVPAVLGVTLTTLSTAHAIVSWSGANCGVAAAGVYCWGTNEMGQVGNGTRSPNPTLPSLVASPVPLVQVSAGGEHACGLAADGTPYCWGNGYNGELGRALAYPGIDSVPGVVPGSPSLIEVQTGLFTSCGRTAGGQVWCWGLRWGMTPVRVALPEPVVDLRVGERTSCAISVSQVAYCWVEANPPKKELGQ